MVPSLASWGSRLTGTDYMQPMACRLFACFHVDRRDGHGLHDETSVPGGRADIQQPQHDVALFIRLP
jgi:hypothetical protein